MKKTWTFCKLRFLQLSYDKVSLFFAYIFPVLLLLGIGIPLQNTDDDIIEVYYYNQDKSPKSYNLLNELKKSSLIKLFPYNLTSNNITKFTINKAQNNIENKKINFFLWIYHKTGSKDVKMQIFYNKEDPKNNIKILAFENLIFKINNIVFGKNTTIQLKIIPISGKVTPYLYTLLPGIIGMTLLIIGLNGFGLVLVEERKMGILKKLKSMDFSPFPYFGGLFLSRLIISYALVIIMYLIAVVSFDLEYNLSYLLMFFATTISALTFLGLGLLLSTFTKSPDGYGGMITILQMFFIILSGVFYSIDKFPTWLQHISKLIPLTYVNILLKKLFFDSVTIFNLWEVFPEMFILTIWCVTIFIAGRIRFKW